MNLKGSSLIFSLIVLSFLLVSALSVATVSVTARRSSLSSKNSNVAFQVADSAAEIILREIYQKNTLVDGAQPITDLNTLASSSRVGGVCEGAPGGGSQVRSSTPSGIYTAMFLNKNGTSIACGDPNWRKDVVKIKFQGIHQNTARAVEIGVVPECNAVAGKDVDGNDYNYQVVLIGTQCWMAENMMEKNGTDGTSTSGNPWDDTDHGYYAYPPNTDNTAEETTANIKDKQLGLLYQWSAAMKGSVTPGVQGICPTDWHIPTHDEYTALERAVCTSGTCVTDFPIDTSTTGWRGTDEGSTLSLYTSGGNNLSGFSGILAGFRGTGGSFSGRNTFAYLWSSTPSGGSAWYRYLGSGYSTVGRYANANVFGFSVRCLKN